MKLPSVSEFMTHQVHTASSDADIEYAAEIMRKEGIRHLPIVDRGSLTGLVSDRELKVAMAFKEYSLKIAEIMMRDPFVIEPDRSLQDAVLEMARRKIGSCIVAERGKPVGVFTVIDALEYMGSLLAEGPPVGNRTERDKGNLTLARFMTPLPHTIREDEFLLQAADMMRLRGVRHLPVVDAKGKLVGILSDRDVKLASALLPDEDDIKVEDIMTPEPYTASENDDVRESLDQMEQRKLGAVIIMGAGGRIAGLFTSTDAVRAFRLHLGPYGAKAGHRPGRP